MVLTVSPSSRTWLSRIRSGMPLRFTSASFGALPENGSEFGSSMRSKAKPARTNTVSFQRIVVDAAA